MSSAMRPCSWLMLSSLLGCAVVRAEQPIFDTHLHYDQPDTRVFTPSQVIGILEQHRVPRTIVTSAPPENAATLHELEPERIVPFLGVYGNGRGKENWYKDDSLPAHVRRRIRHGPWRGIGELHLFATHRHSPVFHRIVEIAHEHDLPLLMHADPAVIDTIYEIAPQVTVIWAHAGTFPYPDLVADYLDRYAHLHVDLSVRDEQLAPEGKITDKWYDVLVRHSDRFLVGVDTYSTRRWRAYGEVIARIRDWLAQLPTEVEKELAYENATRLFENLDKRGSESN